MRVFLKHIHVLARLLVDQDIPALGAIDGVATVHARLLLLHFRLAVTGHVQGGVVMAAVLNKAQLLAVRLQRTRGTQMETKEERSQRCREAQSDKVVRVTEDIAGSVGKGKVTPSPALAVGMSRPEHSKRWVCISLMPKQAPSLLQKCILLCPVENNLPFSFPIPSILRDKIPATFLTCPALTMFFILGRRLCQQL